MDVFKSVLGDGVPFDHDIDLLLEPVGSAARVQQGRRRTERHQAADTVFLKGS